ncbi:hypothetical protein JTB14_011621 [Gonioctena quinquepunctata]|nr:hypothetical protein JTB14_011621 [Gonioctena quinquepunctata]
MDTDPQHFFQDLSRFLKDDIIGPHETHRLLDTLNRNLIGEQVNSSIIDVYLIHIFHTSDGLLQFIETSARKKKFKKASIQAVEILCTIVNNFPTRVQEHDILSIYTMCTKIMKSDTDSLIKVKVFQLLQISLEKNEGCVESKKASTVYGDFLTSLLSALVQKHSDTVKNKEMTVLGYFAKKYPYLISDPKKVQQTFWRNFETLVAKPNRKVSQNVLEGFFLGFMYFLEAFPLKPEISENKKIADKLYKSLKGLVTVSKTERIKSGNRAALLFLANNVAIFKENLLEEYEFWHSKLPVWLTFGAEERKVAVTVLKAFYQVIAVTLEEKDGEQWKEVVMYFNNYSKTILKTKESSNYEKRLAIFCLKQFSHSSYKHLPLSEVTGLFLMIMQNFEETYILNYNPQGEEWEYLPDYIQTVANFMTFKHFTASDFFCLQRAVINMVKSFHQLPILHYSLVVDSLVMTLFHLKKTQYFDVFLENIVFHGVVWSCSHHHISNEAFSEETTQKVVTVKSYFPLWKGLLNITSNCSYDKHGFFLEDRKYVLERLVNELVKTLMLLINKLNVSVKLKEDNVAITDVEQAYKVEETNDYAIFLNVIDFYREIFNNIKPTMFKKCVCKIITHLTDKCLKYPLISGFYKLLSFGLKIAKNLDLFLADTPAPDVVNCQATLSTFLSLLLDKMSEFKDELLISCLQVLLETPVVVIKNMLPFLCRSFHQYLRSG